MAFDPAQEEYERLALNYARSLEGDDPFQAARTASAFRRRFAWNHDSLPQNDRDRAFHLVARAARLIDEVLPFSAEGDAPGIIVEARKLLDEAVALDPECHDALRMRAAQECPTFEAYYRYLIDGLPAVRESRLALRDRLQAEGRPTEAALVVRPLVRWLSAAADKALVCGRYRKALSLCREALELDPLDHGNVHYTAYLVLAKLEDEKALEELAHTYDRPRETFLTPAGVPPLNGWLGLARAAVALRRGDAHGAREAIHGLLVTYPHAGLTLSTQAEIPDSAFARLAVAPFSADELALAVSEAAVLLQEGVGRENVGSLGAFVADDRAVREARRRDEQAMGAQAMGRNDASGLPSDDEGWVE